MHDSPGSAGGSPRGHGRSTVGSVWLLAFLAMNLLLATVVGLRVGGAGALLGVLGFAAVAVLVAPHVLRRGVDLGEPLAFVALTVWVGVSLKSVYLAAVDRDPWGYSALVSTRPELLIGTSLLILGGMACLSTGYLLPVSGWAGARLKSLRQTAWSERRVWSVASMLTLLSLLSFVLFVEQVGFQFDTWADLSSKRFSAPTSPGDPRLSFSYLRWGASLAQPAFALALVQSLRAGRRRRMARRAGLLAIGGLALVPPIYTSSRSELLYFVLAVLIIVHYARPRSARWLIAAIAIASLLIFQLMTALRPQNADGTELETGMSWTVLVDATVGSRHFADLAKTAIIIDSVPEVVPYQYGRTFTNWVLAPVPRSLWPDKPTLGTGQLLGPAVFGTAAAGVPPGLIAEVHLNFGSMAILPALFIYGVMLKGFHALFRARNRSDIALLIYALSVGHLTYGVLATDVSKVVVQLATSLVPLLVVLPLLRRR